MRESDIERHLVKRVKELGGEVRKIKWIGRNGAPDRLVMLPAIHHPAWKAEPGTTKPGEVCWGYAWDKPAQTIWVELKAPGLAALFPHTPHERQQHREHERMRSMGQRVVVIDSIGGVEELLA